MFYVVDYYEEPELLGVYERLSDAQRIRSYQIEDTDGECNVEILTEDEYKYEFGEKDEDEDEEEE